MESLLEKYTQLNNSFRKKKLIYRVGVDAGFFSEYNNMILAMLYCLKNKIHFKLYSRDAIFRYNKGWTDYFRPFCQEDCFPYQRHNPRAAIPSKKYDPRVIMHHVLRPNTFLTFELWNFFRSQNREEHFYIPELGIDGDLQDACRVLVNITWRYNESTQAIVDGMIANLCLPDKYIGLHIRCGDKSKETKLLKMQEYVEKAKSLAGLHSFFVLTDDYRIIKEMQMTYKEFDIYTLCDKGERGYFHEEFQKQNKETIKKEYEKLFASVDILNKAQLFIGTFSSNPGMFLGMRMSKDKSFGLDLDRWQIW